MLPGPVFNAELLTTARRTRYYAIRFAYGMILLFFIGSNAPAFTPWRSQTNPPGLTIQEEALLGRVLFTTFFVVQSIAVLLLTPAFVAGVIADERQRRTLHYLLASPLSSAEIVLGKLAARLTHLLVVIAIGLPVLSLLSLLGGVDPRMIALTFAATLTTVYFVATLSILVSVHARRPREAITMAYLLEVFWLFVPSLTTAIMPMAGPFWLGVYEWVRPVNEWVNITSPFHVFAFSYVKLMGGAGGAFLASVAWMAGLQVGYGSLFLLLALWRVRPVARQAGEGVLSRRGPWSRGGRLLPRPPCGDDAMLWKERHVSRTAPITKAVTALVVIAAMFALGNLTFTHFARPAFVEVWTYGYGSITVNQARGDFNRFLRGVCSLVYTLWALGIASAASSGLTSEREEDTWLSLVATPLDGVEILRGKMIGAVWGFRWVLAIQGVLWLTGLLSGAIHPLGLVAVGLETPIFLWFAVALGTWSSLHASNSGRSLLFTIGTLIVTNGGYLLCFIPASRHWAPVWAGSTPMIEAFSLMSYEDVRQIVSGNANDRYWNRPYQVATNCFIGLLIYLVSAVALTIMAIAQFDRRAGRPQRGPMEDLPRSDVANKWLSIDVDAFDSEADPG